MLVASRGVLESSLEIEMFRSYFTSKRLVALVCLLVLTPSTTVFGQFFPNRVGVVGGVKVDADGVVRSASVAERGEQLKQLRTSLKSASGQMAEKTSLRMISLRMLQEAIQQSVASGQPLSEEVMYLAGLQRVEYVLAYPEQNDIVIAGPAEPWTIRDDSSVVGKFSGRPVLHLEDLITALRSTDATQKEVVSVSIDPTPEGELRLKQVMNQIKAQKIKPELAENAMKEAFGPQRVSLTAVPKSSRMAQTLVAVDYQMKRLAMNLESSPVAGLTSYMEMIRNGGSSKGMQPRWWMTSKVDSIAHSEDRLAWKINGSSVKAMTEDQYISESGQRVGSGEANKLAQKWSDLFTAKYDQLCATNSVFGDLINVIDLNLVATIIRSQQLESLAGCNLDLLTGTASAKLETPEYRIPKSLDPQCSFVRGQAGVSISVSGGVEINPWKMVSESSKVDEGVKAVYAKAATKNQSWWWN
jgi:Protein of unknown function (DUF1598)